MNKNKRKSIKVKLAAVIAAVMMAMPFGAYAEEMTAVQKIHHVHVGSSEEGGACYEKEVNTFMREVGKTAETAFAPQFTMPMRGARQKAEHAIRRKFFIHIKERKRMERAAMVSRYTISMTGV